MPESKSERVLQALFTVLSAHMPAGSALLRNSVLPQRIPAGGWICLRDGDPGDPETLLSPLTYVFEHRAEVDVVLELQPGARDAAFDQIKLAIGSAIAVDRTLGGLCDYVEGEAPLPVEVPVEAGAALKAATIGIVLFYATSDPLV